MTPTPRKSVPGAGYRIVLCEACGSEGRIYHPAYTCDNYGNPMEYEEPCPYCEGTGGVLIEVQPIEAEDFAEAFGS
jgi:hypothetical protein